MDWIRFGGHLPRGGYDVHQTGSSPVPYVTQDDSTTPIQTTVGNPSLRAEHANNYDALVEDYLKPVGLVQIGVFSKQLSDPLVLTQFTPTSGTYAGQLVSQWANGGSATLSGFEISYQQHMTYLPGALGGLGLLANYSWTTSKVTGLPGRADSPQLQRQAPNTWNVSPTYGRGVCLSHQLHRFECAVYGQRHLGLSRADVAAAFGDRDSTNSGYTFTATGLGGGWYVAEMSAHSYFTGVWTQSQCRVLRHAGGPAHGAGDSRGMGERVAAVHRLRVGA